MIFYFNYSPQMQQVVWRGNKSSGVGKEESQGEKAEAYSKEPKAGPESKETGNDRLAEEKKNQRGRELISKKRVRQGDVLEIAPWDLAILEL